MSRLKQNLVLLIIGVCLSSAAYAGSGPTTTLLVVNEDSPLSLAVANTYRELRNLPETHTLWLSGLPPTDTIDTETFRQLIWAPIEAHLKSRGLADHIDTIAYSAGFPYAVDFARDAKRQKLACKKTCGSAGSLTGMTYFGDTVEKGLVSFLASGNNPFFREPQLPTPPRAPDELESEQFRLGHEAFDSAQYRVSIEYFERAISTYPWASNIWLKLASAFAAVAAYDQAIDALDNALRYGWIDLLQLRTDKHLKKLQSHPDYLVIEARVKTRIEGYQKAAAFSHYRRKIKTIPPREHQPLPRYISLMLGYTGPRGNSVPEIQNYLQRAASSDWSQPDGTVYLMDNRNKRSVVRRPLFGATVNALKSRNRKVEIVKQANRNENGRVPYQRHDVIGVVTGTRIFDWPRSGSVMLPGAIAESFTSYGGHFAHNSQTKLSDFLRHGAAGSSGAVREPYAFIAKFPVPNLHVYYADGYSLAESFYLSVSTPYQLIIVGDPLARPFAHRAKPVLDSLPNVQSASGVITLSATANSSQPIAAVEYWIDGTLRAQRKPGQPYEFDTRTLADGPHELTLVAIEGSAVATRSAERYRLETQNHGVEITLDPVNVAPAYGAILKLTGETNGDGPVTVYQGSRPLVTTQIQNGSFEALIDSTQLGPGNSRLHARVGPLDKPPARSHCVTVTVSAPDLQPPTLSKPVNKGLRMRYERRDGRVAEAVVDGLTAGDLKKILRQKPNRIEVSGAFEVAEDGLYEMIVETQGQLSVAIDGVKVFDGIVKRKQAGMRIVTGLAAGWHRLELSVNQSELKALVAWLGGPTPSYWLEGDHVSHE